MYSKVILKHNIAYLIVMGIYVASDNCSFKISMTTTGNGMYLYTFFFNTTPIKANKSTSMPS